MLPIHIITLPIENPSLSSLPSTPFCPSLLSDSHTNPVLSIQASCKILNNQPNIPPMLYTQSKRHIYCHSTVLPQTPLSAPMLETFTTTVSVLHLFIKPMHMHSPSLTLTGMAICTLKAKYKAKDYLTSHIHHVFCALKDQKDIYYQFEDKPYANSGAAKTVIPTPPLMAAVPAIVASPVTPTTCWSCSHERAHYYLSLYGNYLTLLALDFPVRSSTLATR